MKITYLGHSGFWVETEEKILLFDYYEGELPAMEACKPLYVFVSHGHGDHFNPHIFTLGDSNENTCYILSYDIKLKPWNLLKWNVSESILDKVVSVKASQYYEIGDIRIETLKSTDKGVAFLLRTEGKVIYHAGDLNWWFWKEESKQANNNMTADFKRQMEKMKDMPIDLAFLPLDPRQGDYYYLGFKYMLETAKVKYAFPMHMWGDYTIIKRFAEEKQAAGRDTCVMEITADGQEFKIV